MEFFDRCGMAIEAQWQASNYAEESLPDTAAAALEALPAFDCWEVVRWIGTTSQLPKQHELPGKPGQQPVTVYCGSQFTISLYFGLGRLTDIHQHAFCGAFKIVSGTALHSTFDFEVRKSINAGCRLGDLQLRRLDLLRVGDVRTIVPGGAGIHSLIFLDQPSVTLIIRNVACTGALPQWFYRAPGLSYNPKLWSPLSKQRLETVGLLLSIRPPGLDAMLCQAVAHSDLWTSAQILEKVWHSGPSGVEQLFRPSAAQERFQSLMGIARDKFGAVVDELQAVFIEESRLQQVRAGFRLVLEPTHRLFLALLVVTSDWRRILEAVGCVCPEEPASDIVSDWIYELMLMGTAHAKVPNVLGLNPDRELLAVIEWLVESVAGRSVAPPEVPDLDRILEHLRRNVFFESLATTVVPCTYA